MGSHVQILESSCTANEQILKSLHLSCQDNRSLHKLRIHPKVVLADCARHNAKSIQRAPETSTLSLSFRFLVHQVQQGQNDIQSHTWREDTMQVQAAF